MRNVTLAATQMACGWDIEANLARAETLVREAAGRGAQIILIQELFATPYFCQDQSPEFFVHAHAFEGNPLVARFAMLAAELGVVLPVSYFEKAGKAFFNSVAVVDADGKVLGNYRKSHIPDGPGYTEKFYFSPGDTGFRAWKTKYATIGVGICWDQWFPEAARAMALKAPRSCSIPRRLGPSRRIPQSIPPAIGSGRCRAVPLQTSCRSWPRTASVSSRGRTARRSPSTAPPSSPIQPAPRSPKPTGRPRPC